MYSVYLLLILDDLSLYVVRGLTTTTTNNNTITTTNTTTTVMELSKSMERSGIVAYSEYSSALHSKAFFLKVLF